MKRNITGIIATAVLTISAAVAFAAPKVKTAVQTPFKPGMKVEISVNGKWIPATILSYNGAKYKVHFNGWSKSTDGWAGTERIRAYKTAKTRACA